MKDTISQIKARQTQKAPTLSSWQNGQAVKYSANPTWICHFAKQDRQEKDWTRRTLVDADWGNHLCESSTRSVASPGVSWTSFSNAFFSRSSLLYFWQTATTTSRRPRSAFGVVLYASKAAVKNSSVSQWSWARVTKVSFAWILRYSTSNLLAMAYTWTLNNRGHIRGSDWLIS